MADSGVVNRRAAAIMQVLPAVNDVVAIHCAGDADRCRQCAVADPRGCPVLLLAAGALDVIIQCWRLTKTERDCAPEVSPRDLRAAVRSRHLTTPEVDALTEILGALELAGKQADDAGTCLPALAGIAVAVVDTYRAAVADGMSHDTRPWLWGTSTGPFPTCLSVSRSCGVAAGHH